MAERKAQKTLQVREVETSFEYVAKAWFAKWKKVSAIGTHPIPSDGWKLTFFLVSGSGRLQKFNHPI